MNFSLRVLILLSITASHLFALDLLEESTGFAPTVDAVTVSRHDNGNVEIVVAAGPSGYPGVQLKPKERVWEGSSFGHVVATIRNDSTKPLTLNLRIDNEGHWRDNPWNVEKTRIDPGETRELRTYFGFHNGLQRGFALDSSKLSGLQIFTHKNDDGQAKFTVLSLRLAGEAGEDPAAASEGGTILEPADGVLFSVKPEFQDAVQVIRHPDGKQIVIRREKGLWNLRKFNRVAIGNRPASEELEMRVVDSNGQATAWKAAYALFDATQVWEGEMGGSEDRTHAFDSRKVKAIEIRSASDLSELVISDLVASVNRPPLPEWVGQRPPVEGDWELTFSDEFEGNTIDLEKWNITGPNYWGAKDLTHWSRDNVIVNDGTASIRMERKSGHHNDDPEQHTSDYQGGYLDTFDKWRQRYGYFEARLKFPEADGLWPAFWMMPDAGREVGEMWKRQKTEPRGMEFDIVEHLTSWGPFRYHIALHWDGYGKNHRSIGTSDSYFSPDEEGFVTAGLLWTPGEAVFYANGNEIGRVASDRISDVPGMFILSMPIGGWDNKPIDDSQLPADYVIDYVKAWQRSDLASEADGFFR